MVDAEDVVQQVAEHQVAAAFLDERERGVGKIPEVVSADRVGVGCALVIDSRGQNLNGGWIDDPDGVQFRVFLRQRNALVLNLAKLEVVAVIHVGEGGNGAGPPWS
jgi:hypothetical protein